MAARGPRTFPDMVRGSHASNSHSMTQTNWELIRDAASGSTTSRASLDAVSRRAWPAIFAFIRASGRSSDEASELTQGFIADVFLSRHLLEKADPGRGRFRTLLIGAVRNYLNDMHRRRTAQSRMPEGGVAAIDALTAKGLEPAEHEGHSPERAFNTRYVATLIRAAAERLQKELAANGDEASWEIFRMRVLHAAFSTAFRDRFPVGALASFLVTVADLPLLGVGAPFWGLVAGVALSWAMERADFGRT